MNKNCTFFITLFGWFEMCYYQLITGRLTRLAQLHFMILTFVPTKFVIK